MERIHVYNGFVDRVVDGDTIDITINQGFGNTKTTRLRFLDLDTAEKNSSNALEKMHGIEATEFLRELIESKHVFVRTVKKSRSDIEDKTGKYGRYLAYIYITLEDLLLDLNITDSFNPDAVTTENSVNARMLDSGFAKKKVYI
jgi:endonuclease YncB( thermonuclease family)